MLTTHDALEAVDNRVTYRQLDYWLRTRRITLADQARGSGHHRVWTPVEVAALQEFVNVYEQQRDMASLVADGSAWVMCLERQSLHLVREVPS
jgi:hypothetical protein